MVKNDGDVIGGTASSLALLVSDIPFNEPIAEVRVARVDGAFVVKSDRRSDEKS